MVQLSRRIPDAISRKDLAQIVAPTYAASADIDLEEACGRMRRALGDQRLAAELYGGLTAALAEMTRLRAGADELIDNLSAGISKRRARVKAAPMTPEISTAMVTLNLALGYAPESMRAAVESERGRALAAAGMRELGTHLLRELIK